MGACCSGRMNAETRANFAALHASNTLLFILVKELDATMRRQGADVEVMRRDADVAVL